MFYAFVLLQVFGLLLLFNAIRDLTHGDSTYAQKMMLLFVISSFIQNGGFLLEMLAKVQAEALVAVKMEYFGSSFLALFYMMFVLRYCEIKEKRLFTFILALLDLIVVVLVWTCESHPFFYTNISFDQEGLFPHLNLSYGAGFFLYMIASAIIPWIVSVITLFQKSRQERNNKRKRILTAALGLSVLTQIIMLLYVFRVFPSGYDPTPITIGIIMVIMVEGIWNRKDFDLIRVAANTVLDSLDDCVITLNSSREILSYNAASIQLFPNIQPKMDVRNLEGFPMVLFDLNPRKDFAMGGKRYEGHVRVLEDVDHEIRGYSILIIDMTKTYEYIDEIDEMRKKAERINQTKSDFLANMSHEIRTPMNAIVGMSELVIEESKGRKVYGYANDIKTAALNLLSIINDILDLSKVEAGKMEILESEYSLKKLVLDTSNLIRITASQKGLEMKVEVDEELPSVLLGDEGRIRQILINLLNNGIKFTKRGYVKLSVGGQRTNEDCLIVRFVIEDTGIGIRKTDIQNVFEAFEQVDMGKSRTNEGTGLGLAITKSLTQLMHGNITVESSYGKGTKFTVILRQKIVDETPIGKLGEIMQKQEEQRNYEYVCPKLKVLVVDDNLINRKVALEMMKKFCCHIVEAESGFEAIEWIKKEPFDILFMDHMMPNMDGVEATRIIRQECGKNGQDAIVIALTANALSGAKEMFLSSGFNDFLAKPFEKEQLYEVLDKWIKKEYKEEV